MEEKASTVHICLYTHVDGVEKIVEVYKFSINDKLETAEENSISKKKTKKQKHQNLLKIINNLFQNMDQKMKEVSYTVVSTIILIFIFRAPCLRRRKN